MDESTFWLLIVDNLSRDEFLDLDLSRLQAALEKLPDDDLVAFQGHFDRIFSATYTQELWGAAYLINGGCSDDGFDYFRAALIGLGPKAYAAAMSNPDDLAPFVDGIDELDFEGMMDVALQIYRDRHDGADMPRIGAKYPDLEQGWDFDDDEEMERRYPRLFAQRCGP